MADETKPVVNDQNPPAGGTDNKQPEPNQNPSDDLQKKIKEMEEQIKERDTKLADAQNTLATIEARRKEQEAQKVKETASADLQTRIKRITESMTIDPETASVELGNLLSEVQTKAAKEAVQEAVATVRGQSAIEKLKINIKVSNPDFDDEIVDDVLAKANMLASTNKYKTAEEAVEAATKYVKTKFESYAQKKNAAPPLPSGARAESGGSNQPPQEKPEPKILSPLEELDQANEAKRSKFNLRE